MKPAAADVDLLPMTPTDAPVGAMPDATPGAISDATPGATLDAPPDAPPAGPQGCTHFKLRQVQRRVSQRYDQALAPCGLKTTQYSLLSHVIKLGPLRPGTLAMAMAMDPSTLTRNLRPLVDAGWVALGAGADGRSRQVRITDAGLAKRTQASACWRSAQADLNQLLGPARVLALHAQIDDCLELLAPPPAGDHHD